jgi:hypothetical protein
MTNVPRNTVKRNNKAALQVEGDHRPPNTTRSLKTTGRKNRNMGASIYGRMGGGGFPKNRV